MRKAISRDLGLAIKGNSPSRDVEAYLAAVPEGHNNSRARPQTSANGPRSNRLTLDFQHSVSLFWVTYLRTYQIRKLKAQGSTISIRRTSPKH